MATPTRGTSTAYLYKIKQECLYSYKDMSRYNNTREQLVIQPTANFDDIAPECIVNKDVKDFNYIYVLGKYYYIRERSAKEGGMWILKLYEDTLQTWLASVTPVGILNLSSSKYNADMQQQLPLVTNKAWERKVFSKIKDENMLGSTFIVETTFPYEVKIWQ